MPAAGAVQAPGRPQVAVVVHRASLSFFSPPYPALQADLALTYSSQEIVLGKGDISLAEIPVLSAQGKLAQPLRAALTGTSTSPGIFDVLEVLGRAESLARLKDQSA